MIGTVMSCSVREPRPVDLEGLDDIQPHEVIQAEKPDTTPGPVVIKEKLAPIVQDMQPDARIYSGAFSDVALAEVIKVITRDSRLNLSVASDVDLNRRLTVHLQQATLSEALDMVIVNGAGYAWKIEGDNLFVRVFEERIYQFDYLDMAGETDIEIGGDMLASGVEESGVSGKFQIKAKRDTKMTDVWTNIQEALDMFKSEHGIVRINRSAGIIYMADRPGKVASMVQFLDSLMDALHRQVFIEAKIMEVSLSEDNSYGIDWSNLNIAFTDSGNTLTDVFSLSINGGSSVVKAGQSGFSAILDFLKTQGDVSVVSNPHLSVMNGQSAVLTVGYQFPYGDVSGVDRDAETGVITFGTSIKRAILGLQLGHHAPHFQRWYRYPEYHPHYHPYSGAGASGASHRFHHLPGHQQPYYRSPGAVHHGAGAGRQLHCPGGTYQSNPAGKPPGLATAQQHSGLGFFFQAHGRCQGE